MLQAILAFLLAIFILVLIHEWGHFAVARLFKIKVLKFSIGMGKELYSFYDKKGTKFSLSMLPIGGYVSLLGEQELKDVPDNEKKNSFVNKHPLIKIAVLFAGPFVNLLFAVLVFWIINLQGVDTLKPIIGNVLPNSIAKANGFANDMEIISVNQMETKTWEDVYLQIINNLGTNNRIKFSFKSLLNGQEFEKELPMTGIDLDKENNFFTVLGIQPIDPMPPVVGSLMPEYPAIAAGILENDKILAVDGMVVKNRMEVIDYVKNNFNTINFTILRNNQKLNIKITPQQKQVNNKMTGMVGIVFANIDIPSEYRFTKKYSVIQSLSMATQKVVEYSIITVKMIYKIIMGDVSTKHLTGPVSIAKHAGQAVSFGIMPFLSFLAIISIGLGVLNLLPIPVLDGGQIVFSLYELFTGSIISDNFRVISNIIGIILIIFLTALALFNDISSFF